MVGSLSASAGAVRSYVKLNLADALGEHGVGDLQEAGDVGAHDKVALLAILLGGVVHVVEHAAHELLELAVDLLEGPGQVLGVLAHLEAGHEHAAGVGSLTGHKGDAVLLEVGRGLDGRGHVRALADHLAAVGDERLGVLEQQRVLAGAGQGDVAGQLPHAAAVALVPHGTGLLVNVHGERDALVVAGALLVVDVLEHGVVDAVGILDPAVGVGAGQHLAAELRDLLDGIDSNVAGTVNDDVLALEGVAAALEVLVHKVDQAVAGGLGTGERAAEGDALAGQDAGVLILQALVLAEQIADLAAADTDITGGAVHELADVAVQLGHKALAEAHDLGVRLAVGVKVSAALAAAHGQAGQAVLEALLKAEELQDRQVDGGVEPQTALVGADGPVELAAPATVGMPLAIVVAPHHPEGEHTLRLHHTAQQIYLLILRVLFDDRLDGGENLLYGLHELRLVAVLCPNVFQNTGQICVHNLFLLNPCSVTFTGRMNPVKVMITPISGSRKGVRGKRTGGGY